MIASLGFYFCSSVETLIYGLDIVEQNRAQLNMWNQFHWFHLRMLARVSKFGAFLSIISFEKQK